MNRLASRARPLLGLCASFAALAILPGAFAYNLIGTSWKTGAVNMVLHLDASAPAGITFPLNDGATTWNAVARSALDEWNVVLGRCQFTSTISNTPSGADADRVTDVFFANNFYGQSFDTFTLAVTLVDHYDNDGLPTVQTREADLIVNNAYTWNSYRGAKRTTPVDLRRVLIHEFGHVLGLDHPDQLVPPQSVTAIMNSSISNLDTIQTDDRNGVAVLYGGTIAPVAFSKQPTSQAASAGSSAEFTIAVNGQATPPASGPLLSYKWYFKANGTSTFEKLFTLDSANLSFGSVQLGDAGQYYLEVMTPDQTIVSNVVTLTVSPVTNATNTALMNLSTRGTAGSGSSSMIVGFAVTGSRSKTILLRAIGPTLSSFGVNGTLADPVLTLVNQNAPNTTIATSPTTWDQNATTAETIRATSSRVGAFGLAAGTKDAVILTTLAPGLYTAKTASATGASGVVLVEAYDADTTFDPTSRLSNLSTRGFVGVGSSLLIAGFSVQGPGPRTYLIRVSGPTLASFGVTNTLFDPYLKLYQTVNGSSVFLRETDDWDSPSTLQPALRTAFTSVQAFTFSDRKESAMLVTLQPGNYTAQASGNDNGGSTSATGNALIEIYEMP